MTPEDWKKVPQEAHVAAPWPAPTPEQTIKQLRYENTQLKKWLEEAQARYRGAHAQLSLMAEHTQPMPWQNPADAVAELVRSREILRDRVRELEAALAAAKSST